MIPDKITIHHSASPRDTTTVEDINQWHKVRFNFIGSLGFYVGYHYVITGDGRVTQTRRDNEMGAHVRNNNGGNIGICLTGNFMSEEPSDSQISSLSLLVDKLKADYNIEYPKAHREYNQTECCGDNLFVWVLKQRVSFLQKMIAYFLKKLSGI